VARTNVLPAPPAGQLAAYFPTGPGYSEFAVIHLDGWHTTFRFMVNMLGHQGEFAAAAAAVLVDMRDDMTPARFDTMALQLLGEDRYKKLRHRFERSWECGSCYSDVVGGQKYVPTNDAGVFCARCCEGHPEYVRRLVTRSPDA
jgi:hypothetical protein